MKLYHFLRLTVVAVSLLAVSVQADTLFFRSTPPVNILWSSLSNWFLSDGMGGFVPAGHLPLATDNAIVMGLADAQAGLIQLNTLIVEPGVTVDNGAFIVQTLQMGAVSVFSGSVITVDSEMDVLGGSTLTSVTLTINQGAFMLLSGGAFLAVNGTLINNEGQVVLTGGSSITGVGGTGNTFHNQPNAALSSSGAAAVAGPLLFNNSGTVMGNAGTLTLTGITWTNTSGTGIFNAAASNATIVLTVSFAPPGLNVDPGVTFLFTGPGVTSLAAGATVKGTLQVGAVDSQTLAFTPGHLVTTLGGSTIGGAGLIHVLASNNVPSTLTFTGLSVTATAITIDAGAQLSLVSGGSMLSNVINNAGTTLLTGGNLTAGGGAIFNNLTGGTFTSSGDVGFVGAGLGGSPVFNNAGTFRKNSGTGTATLGAGVFFNNAGLLDVQSGTVSIDAGTSSGQFNTAAGTVLMFNSGTHTLNSGATFTGGGLFKINGFFHPTVYVNGNVSMPNLEIDNANIVDGPGQLTVNGPFVCNSGVLQGSGTLNLLGASTLMSGDILSQRTLNNSGTITVAGPTFGGLAVNNSAVINNLSGALFDVQNDATFFTSGTQPVFNNAGTFRKSAGSGITQFSVNFNNSGSVLVNTQTVWFFASYQQTAGTTVVNQGATIQGNVLNIQGGTLGGAGTINAAVNNSAGAVSPGMSPGLLTISGGNTYTQTVGGTLSIELGGLTVGTQYDQLAVSGAVTLGGSLNVSLVNGFVPSPGQQFTILTCASRTGTFPVKNGTYLGNGVALVPVYSNTSVVLVVSNVTVLQPLIGFAQNGNNFQLTWPSVIGQPYQVEYSSDLFQWFVLSNLTATGTSASVIDPTPIPGVPQRFYRLR